MSLVEAITKYKSTKYGPTGRTLLLMQGGNFSFRKHLDKSSSS